jgi:hypothetical protein
MEQSLQGMEVIQNKDVVQNKEVVESQPVESQPIVAPKPRAQSDWIGRLIGMLVFLLGVGLLVIVFQAAHTLFTRPPDVALGLKFSNNPKTDPSAGRIGSQFGYLLIQVACLFVMSISGSLIAQKGVNLYFSALRAPSNSSS